ncbi:MAG: hypothetical protein AAF639_13245 [Chloroflexota bacterium]
MASYFQDDTRESEMIRLFELTKDKEEGRSGVDAFLEIGDTRISFELKTTSKGSVTTVRDFGPDHIQKWQNLHWLFGFFNDNAVVYKYGSPAMMYPWIAEKKQYISTNFWLATLLPEKLTLSDLYHICGEKLVYTYDDARAIQKNQYNKSHYISLQDVEDGYSPTRMLEILSDRAKYLIERGSTLNNPHIPARYFEGWEEITQNHAKRLRELVEAYLAAHS